jgi:hypothetical protein
MSDISAQNSGGIPQGSEAIKKFQLTTDTEKKSSKEYGLAIAKDIWSKSNTGVGGYYYNRNARFFKNRNYANGRIDIQAMFKDRFQFNSKENYINLNWNALQIVNRIVSGLVGRWMSRNEKIQVSAIDTLSIKEKEEEYNNIEFLLYNREMLEQLQAESGVQLIPQDQFIPSDKEELNLWQQQFQRLPEEILYEMGCNDVLASNGWFDVLKEKMLHDAAEVLFVGTYTCMDADGVVKVRWVKPEDAIYSYSEYPDFRDTTWRGEAPTIKISELRKRYGKEFNPDNPLALTEEELWKIAQTAKEFQFSTNLTWTNTWYNAFLRPYDEWNVRKLCFEFKSLDSEPYTITKTKGSGSTYVEKGYPKKTGENRQVIEDKSWNIYEGVYLPDVDKLVKWNIKKNMIRPQDPKEIGQAEFSYSFVMPQNYLMRNMAVPEKIEAAVDGMILALLKMQQVVSRMRPTGAAIDESAIQNIDYGLGYAGNSTVNYKRLYDQTGDIYYRGVDAEGNRIPIPITELKNSGFLDQMSGLIQNYQFNYQILKDELGEDPNLISSALQPRVTSGNVEASQLNAEFATDYIYRAYAECMKITARKVSCLLKDSVKYGADAYRRIVKSEDIGDRQFTTDIKLMSTIQEIAKFEIMMNEAMRSTPSLVLYLDPFQLMRIAKEDIKLAEMMFRQATKKMLINEERKAMQNQQQTIEGQIASAQAAEEEKRKTQEQAGLIEIEKTKMSGDAQNKNTVLSMIATLLKPSTDGVASSIPATLQPLVNAVIDNVMVSTVASTEEQKQKILAEMQAAREAEMQQQQQQQPMQPPMDEQINQQPPAME